MECPFCQSNDIKVLESRSSDDGKSIRRRRECNSCSQRFTTYERVEFSQIIVLKNSGIKQLYCHDKLLGSILRSCNKDDLKTEDLDKLMERVETKMYKNFNREILSQTLGELVLAELKELDLMAYLRYASIFKKFQSPEEFIKLVSKV